MVGKILSFIGTATMVVLMVLCLSVSIPRLFGCSPYVVVSGSMEPAIPVGSLVFSRSAEPAGLEPGDVIVFYTEAHSETPVTHRVVENHVADGEIITKGDANASNDLNPITYDNVVGKVVFHIPRVGYLTAPFGTVLGKFAAIMFIAAGYLLTMIGSSLSKKEQS